MYDIIKICVKKIKKYVVWYSSEIYVESSQ